MSSTHAPACAHSETGVWKELAGRDGDGLLVRLLWNANGDRLLLVVEDARSGAAFVAPVPRDRGLDAFRHPFTYIGPATEAAPTRVEQVAA